MAASTPQHWDAHPNTLGHCNPQILKTNSACLVREVRGICSCKFPREIK